MELQNVPTKLANKFKKANIRTVEDLQKNYNKLINGLGFGGIFVASLLDYMQREGIKRPEGTSTRRETSCKTKKALSFNPPPSKLLTKAFIKANIYSVSDLEKKFKKLIKTGYFGDKRIDELYRYMKKLGIKDIPNDIKEKRQESTQSQLELIKKIIDSLVKKKHTKFIFPCSTILSIAFAKLHIENMKDLQKKLPILKKMLRCKVVAISEFRNWILDTNEFYKKHKVKNKQDILTIYENGIQNILNCKEIKRNQYNPKISAYLTGKYVEGFPRIDGQAIILLNNIKTQIQKYSFLSENEILRILSPHKKEISANDRTIAYFLCRATGLKIRDLKRYGQESRINIFATKNSDIAHSIKELSLSAYDFLQSEVIPTDIKKITTYLNKQSNNNFSENFISHLLNNLSFIEKKGGKYTIPINKLKTRGDIAARLLYMFNKKCTTEEICNKINKVFKIKGKPSRVEVHRAMISFEQCKLISYNPKTEEWAFNH